MKYIIPSVCLTLTLLMSATVSANEADRKQAVTCFSFGQVFVSLAKVSPKTMGHVTRKDSQKLARIMEVAIPDSQRLSLSDSQTLSSLQKNLTEQGKVHALMIKYFGFPTQLQSMLDICGKHYSIY
jgi:hypothetical protein